MSAGGTGQATGQAADMPARDPAGAAVLERRYLRLLRCYPPAHREVHREEMLGVLLATARPGQRRPGLRETVNLAACGLAIRVRRIPGWLAADAGQDALAVVSLIVPAVVFILLVLEWAALNAAASARAPFWTLLPVLPPSSSSGESVVVMIAWLAVVVLGLTGRRRTAAKIASVSLMLALLVLLAVLVVLMQPSHDWPGGLIPFLPFGDVPVVLASLAACSLALSPGPRRGLAIVGWRRACLMIAGLSAGFGFPAIVQLANPVAPLGDLAFSLLAVLAIAVAVAVTRVRGPRGPAGRGAGGRPGSCPVSPSASRCPTFRRSSWCPCSSACSPPCWCGRWRSYPGGGGRNAAGGWPSRTWISPQPTQSSRPSALAGGCPLPQPGNWSGPGTPGRPGDTDAARSASGPATPTTRSGHADDHPVPQRTPGQFRKLDAVAVLTGPLLPAPCIGTEHLLLSLLAEGDGIAAQVLAGRAPAMPRSGNGCWLC